MAGRNAWREYVTEQYALARLAWEREAEDVTHGWVEDMRLYAVEHPAPRFKDFLIALRQPSLDDYAA